MSLRRHMLTYRIKKRVLFFILAIVLISLALVYRALLSQFSSISIRPFGATFDAAARRQPRLKPKHRIVSGAYSDSDSFPAVDKPVIQESLQNVLYPNLISKELETLRNRDLLNADGKQALTSFLLKLYPTNWATAPETDEVALDLKYLLMDYGLESNLSCKDIDKLRLGSSISFSRTKRIELGFNEEQYRANGGNTYERAGGKGQTSLAVRSSLYDMDIKVSCMKQIYDADICETMGNYRLLRELLFLTTLNHPSVLRLTGYCLRGNRMSSNLLEKGVIIVTEVGTSMTDSLIFASTWAQRVKLALQVAHLLLYLDRSPFGSLALTQLQLKDFVLVNELTMKLADLDDLEVGERTCSADSDCTVKNFKKGVKCTEGACEGLNSLNNLAISLESVLIPILRNPPNDDERDLVAKLSDLDISTQKLVESLEKIFNKLPSEDTNEPISKDGRRPARKKTVKNSLAEKLQSQELIIKDRTSVDEVMSLFVRMDLKNFAGIYDYPCTGSRVPWGCVFTVQSLTDGATLCMNDMRCQCFVTFSTHPESETLMTVVLKNNTDSAPHTSSGTTLFIRRPFGNKESKGGKADENEEPEVLLISSEISTCTDSVQHAQESARSSRENRLMTHLGLRGMREQSWRRSVLSQSLGTPARIVRMEGGGGRFIANLTGVDVITEDADRVTFIAEEGPKAYHLSYAIVYHMDRLLGLYHTPPCVGIRLTSEVVRQFKNNSLWDNIFTPLIKSDGTLGGIAVVPTPKIMKLGKLILSPIHAIGHDGTLFDRPEKLQLEYVILYWLSRMNLHKNEHLGYKGHLIHFFADRAFANTSVEYSGYLNHCQFPNVVFKNLVCFRCVSQHDTTKVVSRICGLGDMVVKQAVSMLEEETAIYINQMSRLQLSDTIDAAATDILKIVDSCIKAFGRETVLY